MPPFGIIGKKQHFDSVTVTQIIDEKEYALNFGINLIIVPVL
jgi:hypothetical protein